MMYDLKTFTSFFDNTNLELIRQGKIPFTIMSKVLRFQGVLGLEIRFEFGNSVRRNSMPAIEFRKTGMGGKIFKEIFSSHR